MANKNFGATLMILGTSIGAGIIALPILLAGQTFGTSIFWLCVCWFIMTLGALALLEVNLWLGPKNNFASMAKATLGVPGQLVAWFFYLLLFYSLLCAYIAGTADVMQVVLSALHFTVAHWIEILLVLLLMGYIIVCGIKVVDLTNRVLVFVKLGIYLVVVAALFKHVAPVELSAGTTAFHLTAFMVMFTSFGYANVLPTLVDYLDRDHKQAVKIVLIGSLIPLFIYIVWIAIIQGVIPRDQLLAIATSPNDVAALLQTMQATGAGWVATLANIFMSICALTSFLGVALAMVDFLADGTKVNKQSSKGWMVYALAFIPPTIIVLLAPNVFIKALSYAGICCVVLLVLLPVLMVLVGRHVKKFTHEFRVPGGAWTLLSVAIASVILLVALVL
jgi:tyrosine-specific transport protein